jgi:hypothetical protein
VRLDGIHDAIDLNIITMSDEYPRPYCLTTYRLTLEGLPQDRAVLDRELRISRAWPHSSRRDIGDVHDTHDIIFAIATSLQVLIELCLQSVLDLIVEEGRVDADFALQLPQEEHRSDVTEDCAVGGRRGCDECGSYPLARSVPSRSTHAR